jgi:AcrR family transcriptional regulator
MIAAAADELGLENLTLRAVADHLGVSIAALYHHVSSKEDLLRIGAEVTAGKLPLPRDHGQHWAVWLLEWGMYNREAFLADSGLLTQYVCGGITGEIMATNIDLALGALVRQGFSAVDAMEAYELVSSTAIGQAVKGLREREAGSDRTNFGRVLEGRPADALPQLRRLLDESEPDEQTSAFTKLETVIVGIALRRGDNWRRVASELQRRGAGDTGAG